MHKESARSLSRRDPRLAWVGIAVLSTLAYFLLGPLQGWWMTAVNLASAAVIVLRSRRRRSGWQVPWMAVGAGLAIVGIGNGFWFFYNTAMGASESIVLVANLFYGAGYMTMAGGILLLAARSCRASFHNVVIDALIAAAGTVTIWWAALIQPLFRPGQPIVGGIVAALYPLGDVALLGASAALVVAGGGRNPARRLLLVAVGSLLAADFVYYWFAVTGSFVTGGAIDALWILGYLLPAAAALHPSATALRPAATGPALGRVRVGAFLVTAVIGPVALATGAVEARHVSLPAFSIGNALLLVLVLVRMVGLLRNVEARARENEAQARRIEESEEGYRRVLDGVNDVIFHVDTGGHFTFVNRAFTRHTGFSVEDCIGAHFLTYVHEDDRSSFVEKLQPLFRGEATEMQLECRYVAVDGSVRWAEATIGLARDKAGNATGASGTLSDITARKVAQLALAEAEGQYRTLVEHIPAVTYTDAVDDLSTNLYVSPRIDALLGFEAGEWSGRQLWAGRLHPDDRARVLAERDRANETGDPFVTEYRMLHRNGRVVWLRDEAILVQNPGEYPYWQGFLLDVTDRKLLEEELTHQAFHDGLTRLSNRALFSDRLGHALSARVRGNDSSPLAVLFIDLDDFKTVNDSLGHEAGDELLRAVAGRLMQSVRAHDTVARFGGDEFGVLVEDMEGSRDAVAVAERILAASCRPYLIAGREVVARMSIGIAISEDRTHTVDELLRNADLAMYIAKREGSNEYALYEDDMHTAALGRLQLKADLTTAVRDEELFLVYQPIVDLESRRIVGAEALLRWRHRERGIVPPLDFVPVAEETGLIVEIGEWVLEHACATAASWSHAGDVEAPSITVNLSIRQLQSPGLVPHVRRVLGETGLAPSRLVLEITESALMTDVDRTVAVLRELKETGVRIAVDDFGTGYSSLSYLQRFPIDILKIDRAFVRDVGAGPEDSALARAVIMLGQSLRLQTIAEGVETEEQRRLLLELGCRRAQGFYFSKPLPTEEIREVVDRDARASAAPLRFELA